MKEINQSKPFLLFNSCIPVKGAIRSTICDLQRETFYIIPNELFEILTEFSKKTLSEVKLHYNNEYDEVIDEYFVFLLENELIFFSDEPELFPDLDLSWEVPSAISNSIIDVNNKSNHNFQEIFKSLDDLNCKAVEIRFFDVVSLEELVKILDLTKLGRLKSIVLILKYHQLFTEKALEEMMLQHQRVSHIFIHSAPNIVSKFVLPEIGGGFIEYTTKVIDSSKHCGEININSFRSNIQLYTEAQNFNTCLNKKISIDVNGEIKNCPVMNKSYGNIRSLKLGDVLKDEGFKFLWHVNKDKITICKDCEFRYICTDCRGFNQSPEDIYLKPLKCKYNPYTAEWEN